MSKLFQKLFLLSLFALASVSALAQGPVLRQPFTTNTSQVVTQIVLSIIPPTEPGGSTTQIQFNDAGEFNGAAAVTYNKNTGALTIVGSVSATNFILSGTPVDLSMVPTLGHDVWYEPFGAGDNAGGTIGALGWTGASFGAGGGAVNWSNAPGHFGILALSVSTAANSIHAIYLGDTLNSKPWIPSLSTLTGWTNRWIWRLRQTNSVKCYLMLNGNANYTQSALENGMGFFINTSNSPSITAYVTTASMGSQTALVNVVPDTWYTNEMWSTVAGTTSFNVNGGTPVTHTTVDYPLTPGAGLVKTVADGAIALELDAWFLRQ